MNNKSIQFSILYFSHFSIGAGRQMALATLHNQSVILQFSDPTGLELFKMVLLLMVMTNGWTDGHMDTIAHNTEF